MYLFADSGGRIGYFEIGDDNMMRLARVQGLEPGINVQRLELGM